MNTLASGCERTVHGFKTKKDRLTIMVCVNASRTHKLSLSAIEKLKKPRAFKNLNIDLMPVNYYPQPKAWMDQNIFIDWF